jgi:glucose-6-phosphate isomerase
MKFIKNYKSITKNELLNKLKEERLSGEVGYYDLPENSKILIDDAKKFSASQIVVIGIGGSNLGTMAIDSLLRHTGEYREIIYLENTDPIDLNEKFSKIKKDALFIVVSKSGNTVETLTIFKTVMAVFNPKSDRLIVITDKDSNLDKWAKEKGVKTFYIPKNVGGRFSVLSAVGIVPLSIAGYNTNSLLDGAKSFRDSLFEGKEDHLLEKAIFFYENANRYNINVLFAYSEYLRNFVRWYVQLWGESLGKDNKGLTPIGLIGPVDQHSFLQLIMDGPKDKTVTFLKIEDFVSDLKISATKLEYLDKVDCFEGMSFNELINRQCDATYEAVKSRDIPVDKIVLSRLDEDNIGKLIMYYEMLTSAMGILFGINAYNQPAVEIGKKILFKAIKCE